MEQTTLRMMQITIDLIEQYPYDADLSEISIEDFEHDAMFENLTKYLEDADRETADFDEKVLIDRTEKVLNEIIDAKEYEIKIDAVDNGEHYKQYTTYGKVKKILAILNDACIEKEEE